MRKQAAVRAMPDIAKDLAPEHAGMLDWVGMDAIEVPVSIAAADGRVVQSPARVSAYVNLHRPEVRGIHMSRLYLHVDRHLGDETLTPRSIHGLLRDFLDSHQGLSDSAWIRIGFDHLLRRPALASDKSGWRRYPVVISAHHERGHYTLELATEVVYSSTCPCSAALARQLIQEQFVRDFPDDSSLDRARIIDWLGSEQGIVATPHSQRSLLQLRTRLLPSFQDFPIVDLIDLLEQALKTPVQTAVKREDEQAFARLNGANLMFCEDAGRRVRAALAADSRIADFWARAVHQESLHPHDAVAVVSKGVPGGYGPHTEWVG
jgi:GTP cyclohydrolase IB